MGARGRGTGGRRRFLLLALGRHGGGSGEIVGLAQRLRLRLLAALTGGGEEWEQWAAVAAADVGASRGGDAVSREDVASRSGGRAVAVAGADEGTSSGGSVAASLSSLFCLYG